MNSPTDKRTAPDADDLDLTVRKTAHEFGGDISAYRGPSEESGNGRLVSGDDVDVGPHIDDGFADAPSNI